MGVVNQPTDVSSTCTPRPHLDLFESLVGEDVDDGLLVGAETFAGVAHGGDVGGDVGLLDDAGGVLLGQGAQDALEVAADGPVYR